MVKENFIEIKTGRGSGVAFLKAITLIEFCKKNNYTIPENFKWGDSVLNNKGAEIGYITKPGYGIATDDPDYKWIIVWT